MIIISVEIDAPSFTPWEQVVVGRPFLCEEENIAVRVDTAHWMLFGQVENPLTNPVIIHSPPGKHFVRYLNDNESVEWKGGVARPWRNA